VLSESLLWIVRVATEVATGAILRGPGGLHLLKSASAEAVWTSLDDSSSFSKEKVVGSIPIRRLQMPPGRLSSEASDTRG